MAVTITNQAPTLGRGGKSPAFSGLPGTPVDKLYTVALDSSYPDNGESLADIFAEFKEVMSYKVAPANATSAPYIFEINDETTVVTLTSFTGTDSFKLVRGGVQTAAFVRGTNATAALIQTEIRDVWDDNTLTVSGTTDEGPFTITSRDLKHQPVISMGTVSGCTGALSVSTPKLIVSSAFPGTSEVQTLTLTDGPTGGTFTVTWNGQTTSALNYNDSGATVTTAMDALSNLAVGDCVVTRAGSGTQASPYIYTFTFGGDLAGENVPAITASGASLTNSSIALATTTTGTGVKERQTLTLTAGAGATNEVQTLTLTAGIATETFKIKAGGIASEESTAAVTLPTGGYAATTAAQIKTCLLTIPMFSTHTADIAVVATSPTYAITFSGLLAGTDIPTLTMTSKTGAADGSFADTTAGGTQKSSIQTITLTATWDGVETFKLTYGGTESTTAVTRGTNGTAAGVKAVLETIPALATAIDSVSGTTDAGPFVVTFKPTFLNADYTVATAITVTSPSAEGGTVAQTVTGVGAAQFHLTRGTESTGAVVIPSGSYTAVTASQIATCLATIAAYSALTVISTDDTNALYDILVGGSAGGPFTIDFSKTLTGDIGAITVTSKLGSADGSVAETTAGVTGVSEVQTVTLTDGATGGTYTITYSGQTTSALAYNASGATVTTALEALSNIRVGEVTSARTGSGTQASPYVQTLTWRADSGNVAQPTASGTSLTGTTATIATSTQGSEVTDASSLSGVSVKLLVTGYAY